MLQLTNPLQESIFKERYAAHPEETWEQGSRRVADHIGRNERDFVRWSGKFFDEISTGNFMPGGRIWYGSGRPTGQLLSCFVVPTEDSREGWAKSVGENIIIAGTGGGVGANYTPIRPRGTEIRGTGGYATGAVSLMRIENAALKEIKDGGGRRAARMMCLNINHGDIVEFLHAKLDLNELNCANVSVVFNENPEDFFELVRQDGDLELQWQNRIIRTVKAREIWNKIVKHSLTNGEPGLLNGYLANQMNNISYCRTLVSTNPCGEVWMQPYSTCCLGAVNLDNFVKRGSKAAAVKDRIDWDGLYETVSTGIRFLDDVLDVTYYPTPELRIESMATRRIGLGVMGLHYFLLRLGLSYSSPEARDIVDKAMSFIKNTSYITSTYLAVEKGVFPEYDTEKFAESKFVRTLKPSIRNSIRTNGMRNCAVNTIAPTGTTSMVIGVSGGVETIFALGYERARFMGTGDRFVETVVDPLYQEFYNNGFDTSHFESAAEVSVENHLLMQITCQAHLDNSVSKTVNLIQGHGFTEETYSELLMKYFPQLKGFTVYPEGSRGNEPLVRIPEQELRKLMANTVTTNEVMTDCPSGVCTI